MTHIRQQRVDNELCPSQGTPLLAAGLYSQAATRINFKLGISTADSWAVAIGCPSGGSLRILIGSSAVPSTTEDGQAQDDIESRHSSRSFVPPAPAVVSDPFKQVVLNVDAGRRPVTTKGYVCPTTHGYKYRALLLSPHETMWPRYLSGGSPSTFTSCSPYL